MENKIPEIVKECDKDLPHFQDGRVDYSEAGRAPTLVSFLKHEDEILLLKRSDKVRNYKNQWSVVAGYLDELKPLKEKALEEVEEETGVGEEEIESVSLGEPFSFEGEGITWIPHPVLVELKEKPEIELDWENTDYKWVKEDQVEEYLSLHLLEGFRKALSG